MQMSNIILLQKEDIGLYAFSHLSRITHLGVNNKTRKYKHVYY